MWKFIKLNKRYQFLFIFIIAVLVNFSYLKTYPYVAVGDELRDGGLYAARIANGEITNIFGYGAYNAHGLIIPAFNSIFYRIFGNTVLSYRIPTALVGTVDILLLYLIVSNLIGSNSAFWAAILLTLTPLHLFYSRTETVVIFSSFITILLIYLSFRTIKHKNDYIYLALLIGLSFNFHASVKTVGILLLPLIISKIIFFKKLTKILLSLLIATFAVIVGFGPKFLQTTPQIFFNASRLNADFNIFSIVNKYFESLKVIAFSPTTSHYFDHKPLITIPLFILFIIGMLFLFKIKRTLFFLLTYLLVTIPFTNSAITDIINGDHRLMPLLPIISIVIGVAISSINTILSKKYKIIFSIVVFFYLSSLAFCFFYFQKANINDYNNWRQPKEYLSMHFINLIKINNFPSEITIETSILNAKSFNFFHYYDQYEFFLPGKKLTFIGNEFLDDYSAILSTNQSKLLQIDCSNNKNRYICPLNDFSTFRIYY